MKKKLTPEQRLEEAYLKLGGARVRGGKSQTALARFIRLLARVLRPSSWRKRD